MPYATAAQTLTAIAAQLKIAEADLPSYWTAITTRAAAFAESEVGGRLLKRGFTAAEILAWDRVDEVSLDLATWKAIMLGGIYSQVPLDVIKALDRREECDRILVYIDDIWVQPPAGGAGTTVSNGPVAEDPDATFNYDPTEPFQGIHW